MFDFQITGLEGLTSRFEELTEAIRQLNGRLCEVRFDPTKPGQVQAAIQGMERAVDDRLSRFWGNPLVQQLAASTKEKLREEILKRVSGAAHEQTPIPTPFRPVSESVPLGSTLVAPSNGYRLTHGRKGRIF
jgi:hypothetical protein